MQFRFPDLAFKRSVEKLAKADDRSVNGYIVSLLRDAIALSEKVSTSPQDGEK